MSAKNVTLPNALSAPASFSVSSISSRSRGELRHFSISRHRNRPFTLLITYLAGHSTRSGISVYSASQRFSSMSRNFSAATLHSLSMSDVKPTMIISQNGG